MYYFLIEARDGETNVYKYTKEELETRLNTAEFDASKAIQEYPDPVTSYWKDDAILIIKGDIVVPKKVEIITKSELP